VPESDANASDEPDAVNKDMYEKTNRSFTAIPIHLPFIELTSVQSMSRLMYINPVCYLTTYSNSLSKLNAMIVSWLMPTNNYGGIALTIHKSRYTSSLIDSETKEFILSVPTALHRETILQVGKKSGFHVDKFDGVTIPDLKVAELGRWDGQSTVRPLPDNWKKLNIYDLKEIKNPHVARSILNQSHGDERKGSGGVNKFSAFADDDSSSESNQSCVGKIRGVNWI